MTATRPAALQHLVAGTWISGNGDELLSLNPARPTVVVAQGSSATATDLDTAVAAAGTAQLRWAGTPIHQRGVALLAAADILDRNADEWGLDLAAEEGKTRAEGIAEVRRAAQIFRYYGNEGDRQAGEIFSSPRAGEQILVTRKPVGVVGIITPFNFPIAIPAWKIAPALIYGNAVVWKPASTVPLLAMHLASALHDAGLPSGVLNLLIGNSALGDAIVNHAGVDAVTFTGSTEIGRRIASAAAARGVPAQCELGGKNAAVVLSDADLNLAVEQVMIGAFRSSGQKCTATSRLILTEDIAEPFLHRLTELAKGLRVGNPVLDTTDMGPVVSASAKKTIATGIAAAASQGGSILAGGSPYVDGALVEGYFVAPTVIEFDSQDADLWTDELFGPVLAVCRVSDAQAAFAAANDSEFGLSAAVFTRDLSRALEAVTYLDVGVLHINSESAGADPHVPFGGAKKSGLGPKEQGAAAREFFTHTTTVYLRGGAARA